MLDNQKPLEMLAEQARGELLGISRLLVDDGCIELWNLVNQITEIQKSTLIEEFGTAFAGFCSQIGRLAGAMSTMGKIGGSGCEAAKTNEGATDFKVSNLALRVDAGIESFKRAQQLSNNLKIYIQEFRQLGTGLQWLCEKDIQFVVCDAHVLNDHPELVEAEAVRARFAVSTSHLETLSDGWWQLAQKAKEKGDAYEAALAPYSSAYKIN